LYQVNCINFISWKINIGVRNSTLYYSYQQFPIIYYILEQQINFIQFAGSPYINISFPLWTNLSVSNECRTSIRDQKFVITRMYGYYQLRSDVKVVARVFDLLLRYSDGLPAGRLGFRFPTVQIFSILHGFQTDPGAHPSPCPMDAVGSFPGGKEAGDLSWQFASI
jgi:hypothetical protein